MEPLNMIKDTLSDIASTAAEKTEQVVEQTKIRASIADIKRKLTKTYIEIGKLISLTEEERPAFFEEELQHLVQKVRQLKVVLIQRKNELKQSKQMLICPSCSKKTSVNHLYCPNCGAPLTDTEEE